jgi:hypothetical protein
MKDEGNILNEEMARVGRLAPEYDLTMKDEGNILNEEMARV